MAKIQDSDFLLMNHALDGYRDGLLPRDGLLSFLKWQMAVAQDHSVRSFLTRVAEDPTLDSDLAHEISILYKYVRHWEFPTESELSKALPEAIECTLPELIQSVARVGGQLGRVRNMLVGVNVRLDLRGTDLAVDEALRLVSEELTILEGACEEIGAGNGIATAFPSEDAEARPAWHSRDGAPLSPQQILGLANLARWNYPDYFDSYAVGISRHSTPPQLLTERIKIWEQQQLRETEIRELEERVQEAMAQTCPRCNSEPGRSCRTGVGRETAIHKGRYTVAS